MIDSQIQTLAKDIASHLDGWQYKYTSYTWRGEITNGSASIWVASNKGRVSVSGSFPGDHLPYGVGSPYITAALSRGVKAIASDIQKRFLPKYLPLFEQNMIAKTRDEKYYRDEEANRESLAESLNGQIIFNKSIHFHCGNGSPGSAVVTGDSVTVTLRSLSIEAVEKLAVFLKEE